MMARPWGQLIPGSPLLLLVVLLLQPFKPAGACSSDWTTPAAGQGPYKADPDHNGNTVVTIDFSHAGIDSGVAKSKQLLAVAAATHTARRHATSGQASRPCTSVSLSCHWIVQG